MNKTEEATTTFLGAGCAACGSPVMAARNPFYGVDLAVHKYIRNCMECAWYEFAGDSASVGNDGWGPNREHGVHSFWERLSAAIRIMGL